MSKSPSLLSLNYDYAKPTTEDEVMGKIDLSRCHEEIWMHVQEMRTSIKGNHNVFAFINALKHPSKKYRLELVRKYAEVHKSKLDKAMRQCFQNKKEFYLLAKALIIPLRVQRAKCFREHLGSMFSSKATKSVIIDIATTASNKNLARLLKAYKDRYKSDLMEELKRKEKSPLGKMIIGLLTGERNSMPADVDISHLANTLLTDRVKWKKKPELLAEPVCKLSDSQLRELNESFKTVYTKKGQTLSEYVSKNLNKTSLGKLVFHLIENAVNPETLAAKQLMKIIAINPTINTTRLVNLVVSFNRMQWMRIIAEFNEMYHNYNKNEIKIDTLQSLLDNKIASKDFLGLLKGCLGVDAESVSYASEFTRSADAQEPNRHSSSSSPSPPPYDALSSSPSAPPSDGTVQRAYNFPQQGGQIPFSPQQQGGQMQQPFNYQQQQGGQMPFNPQQQGGQMQQSYNYQQQQGGQMQQSYNYQQQQGGQFRNF